ncbi:MAG: N-acetyltransferase, partial [Burkholderiales bacterium]|nr:N-acetyltransferase [Burkholderiales bacterium]
MLLIYHRLAFSLTRTRSSHAAPTAPSPGTFPARETSTERNCRHPSRRAGGKPAPGAGHRPGGRRIPVKLQVAASLADVAPEAWNRLASNDPFLQHAFLHALHETGCACPDTGWAPQYLLLQDGDALAGAMPLYLKSHSYGEYVFDWAWADAYHRHGLEYYPKLLCAIPFTPVVGARLLAHEPEHRDLLVAGALELAKQTQTGSLHVLFPNADDLECLRSHGFMLRQGRQFHWRNEGYAGFEDFLSRLSHDKRKKIRQERRRVREAGITFRWLEGDAIGEEDWRFFAHCYRQTYREHHSSPYLNLEFFRRIGAAMPANLALVVAQRENRA